MAIPISYNIRNLKLRKGLTIMTSLGIALTVTTAVFLMALLAGLQKAFVSSGDPLNVLVMRKVRPRNCLADLMLPCSAR
jgi:putative ABC transport system permease protein